MKNQLFLVKCFFHIFILNILLSINLYAQNNNEVQIGTQIWMKENLNVSEFQNGEIIPQAKNKEEWIQACKKQQPTWCYYNFDSKNGDKYGKLYNWYAVNDKRGLAPKNWRIPTYEDWRKLNSTLGSVLTNAERLKNETGWAESPKSKGTNSSGFSGLPGGYLTCSKKSEEDNLTLEFKFISKLGHWWTSDKSSNLPNNLPGAYYFSLSYSSSNTNLGKSYTSQYGGLSVRCIKK